MFILVTLFQMLVKRCLVAVSLPTYGTLMYLHISMDIFHMHLQIFLCFEYLVALLTGMLFWVYACISMSYEVGLMSKRFATLAYMRLCSSMAVNMAIKNRFCIEPLATVGAQVFVCLKMLIFIM